jgi:hypothetical protein
VLFSLGEALMPKAKRQRVFARTTNEARAQSTQHQRRRKKQPVQQREAEQEYNAHQHKVAWDAAAAARRIAAADDTVKKQVDALLKFTHESTPARLSAQLPTPRTPARDKADALKFRAHIDNRMPTAVCASCARYVAPSGIEDVVWTKLRGKELLRVEEDVVALTTYHHYGRDYHLLPDVIKVQHRKTIVPVCSECRHALDSGYVPLHSLKIVDAGCVPRSPQTEQSKQLLSLTMFCSRSVSSRSSTSSARATY